jgi:hypothetical protein
MNYLILAHPDDECIWFNPEEYDKIVIVFTDRLDVPQFGDSRRQAMKELPYADKIISLDLTESNYWRDITKLEQFEENYHDLCEWLEDNIKQGDIVSTHNPNGEYGHLDHKLVYQACMDVLDCPVNNMDPKLYREARDIYKSNGVWTWNLTQNI